MATKQLRLDVAQLTDVGRKREHNEDNMAYVIPKDPQVMAKKGALFIVADGMGGHAAGEVASEIAVDTVSNMYYQDDSDEVATSLLHAIASSRRTPINATLPLLITSRKAPGTADLSNWDALLEQLIQRSEAEYESRPAA